MEVRRREAGMRKRRRARRRAGGEVGARRLVRAWKGGLGGDVAGGVVVVV